MIEAHNTSAICCLAYAFSCGIWLGLMLSICLDGLFEAAFGVSWHFGTNMVYSYQAIMLCDPPCHCRVPTAVLHLWKCCGPSSASGICMAPSCTTSAIMHIFRWTYITVLLIMESLYMNAFSEKGIFAVNSSWRYRWYLSPSVPTATLHYNTLVYHQL